MIPVSITAIHASSTDVQTDSLPMLTMSHDSPVKLLTRFIEPVLGCLAFATCRPQQMSISLVVEAGGANV